MSRDYFCRMGERPDRGYGIQIIFGYTEGDKMYILNGTEYIEQDRHGMMSCEPTLFIRESEKGMLQKFMDALIEFGIRPSRPIVEKSELDAIKYHLEDMRTLVFKGE